MLSRIHSRACCGVAVYEGQVYSVSNCTCCVPYVSVHRHSSCDDSWVKVRSFTVSLSGYLSLSVKNNQIACSSYHDHRIALYSLTGVLRHTFGSRGCGDAGLLNAPVIIDDDDDGSVLIADKWNRRVQLMTRGGEFHVFQLQPSPTSVRCCVLYKRHFYVMPHSTSPQTPLFKYNCY